MLKPSSLPPSKRYQSETALKARDLVANSFTADKRNARGVQVRNLTQTDEGYRMITVTKEPGKRARAHVVICNMEPGYSGSFRRCPHVRIACDCGRYKYVWNYALLEHDSAARDYTNSEPPVVTNPREVPGACKHALVMLRYLIADNPRWEPPAVVKRARHRVLDAKPIKLTSVHDTLMRLRNQGSSAKRTP